jgi:hypothetical protein
MIGSTVEPIRPPGKTGLFEVSQTGRVLPDRK